MPWHTKTISKQLEFKLSFTLDVVGSGCRSLLGGREKKMWLILHYGKMAISGVPTVKMGMNPSHQHIETTNYKNEKFAFPLKTKSHQIHSMLIFLRLTPKMKATRILNKEP